MSDTTQIHSQQLSETSTVALQRAVDELIALARCMKTAPRSRIRELLPKVEHCLRTVHYFCTYGERKGTTSDDHLRIEFPIRCGVLGCSGGPTLYNVARGNEPTRWRCRDHIPPEITFPIGLHGEDYLATGRKLPKDLRDG